MKPRLNRMVEIWNMQVHR